MLHALIGVILVIGFSWVMWREQQPVKPYTYKKSDFIPESERGKVGQKR